MMENDVVTHIYRGVISHRCLHTHHDDVTGLHCTGGNLNESLALPVVVVEPLLATLPPFVRYRIVPENNAVFAQIIFTD